VDMMHVAQDRDQLRAIVNTVMNLQIPYDTRNFLSSWAKLLKKDSSWC